jgi:hypothetical protein
MSAPLPRWVSAIFCPAGSEADGVLLDDGEPVGVFGDLREAFDPRTPEEQEADADRSDELRRAGTWVEDDSFDDDHGGVPSDPMARW